MATARERVDQSVQFLQEVRTELRKVHWPTWPETRGATIVVLVVVSLVAVYLGLVDYLLSRAIDLVLSPRL